MTDEKLSPEARKRGGRRRRSAEELKANPAKVRNITVDKEAQAMLSRAQDVLEKRLGFLPTIAQTVLYVTKRFVEGNDG